MWAKIHGMARSITVPASFMPKPVSIRPSSGFKSVSYTHLVEVGTPTLAGAKVEGKVVAQVKGEKILIYKYKSKKNYHRRAGHRQAYTKVEITSIG